MPTVRMLRLSRGLTLTELALLVGTLVLTTTPAAEQLSMAAPLPNTAAQTRTARLSLARPRPRGRALLPAADRNPPPREGAQQSWQHDEVALIDARPPAPQSTAVEHGQSDVAPAAAAAAPIEAPAAPAAAPTEAPAAPTEAPTAPAAAPTEAPAAPTEAPAAPIEAATAPAAAPTETPAAPTEAPTASAEAPAPAAPDTPARSESSARGSDVAAFAMQFVGAPYVWGGTDPDGFDCSGFTRYVYQQFGLDLPQFAADQYSDQYGTMLTDSNELQAGDLVFFANTYEPGITHVGIYIGNGDVVQAMSPGIGVAIGNLREDYWAQHYYGALRPLR